MTGGGHFVGAIFQGWDNVYFFVLPPLLTFNTVSSQNIFWKQCNIQPNYLCLFYRKEVLLHKTFHRYTVRAKRGTAQGLRDSQNRSHAPKSAGAALRRYNESALVKVRAFFVYFYLICREKVYFVRCMFVCSYFASFSKFFLQSYFGSK